MLARLSLGLSLSLSFALVAAPGCDGEVKGTMDEEDGRPECDPALAIAPAGVSATPGGLVAFVPEGGTGAYRFRLAQNESGGRVHERTGLYQAGDVVGMDVVALEDDGCVGEASAAIEVTEALSLLPTSAEVPPGTEIAFEVTGGGGTYGFELVTTESGASIDAATGRYRAGTTPGRDTVRVTDEGTSATAEARIDVDPTAALRAWVSRLFLPIGSTAAIPVGGGSGHYVAESSGGGVSYADGMLTASTPGRFDVAVVDRFAGLRIDLDVTVVETQDAPDLRTGPRSDQARAIPLGDANGDGHPDVALAVPGANVGAARAGALYLYAGNGTGVDAVPARVLSGARRDDDFAWDVAVADLTGDGTDDLIVTAPRADPVSGDAGAVYVYAGLADAFFGERPVIQMVGATGSDRFGTGVAACDFNGDGYVDVAVGAGEAEDREVVMRADQQGAVSVFTSYEGRFLGVPDVIVYGEMPIAGAYAPQSNLRLGYALAAADFDGDGLCDLAVHSRRTAADSADDGAVHLFRGRAPTATSPGGIEERPSAIWAASAADDSRAFFGKKLAMADLDGDGLAELVATAYLHDADAGNDAGAVYVFRGRALGTEPAAATTPAASADLVIEGPHGSAWIGSGIAVGDANGDGNLDLLSGDPRLTPEMSMRSRPGVVRVYHGRAGALPSATPSRALEGPEDDAYFGNAIGIVGDLDGGGAAEIVALATHVDADGYDVGAAWVIGGEADTRVELEVPFEASGRQLGQDVAVLGDVTGDGFADVLVGAPEAAHPDRGHASGAAYLYTGSASGVGTSPALELVGLADHSSDDRFGWRVAPVGDFDGDGVPDFAVLARDEERPSLAELSERALEGTCPADKVFNVGAVYVFRGSASGLPAIEPSFVVYGPYSGRPITDFAGGEDIDGDGLDDLILGGSTWNGPSGGDTVGGVAFVRGRAADPAGRRIVICDEVVLDEPGARSDLGASVAMIGDLDGDGCAETAAGAPSYDTPDLDVGALVVLTGFGPTCAETAPRFVRFTTNERLARVGEAIEAGADLDGDGTPDLVVGAPRYRDGRGEVGRAYAVLGDHLAAGLLASGDVELYDGSSPRRLFVDGTTAGERSGQSIAVLPPAGGMPARVAVGGPFGAVSGVANAGDVLVYAFTTSTGFADSPWAAAPGDTRGAEARFGDSLASGQVGARPTLVVGSPWSSTAGLDQGAAYVLDLSP